MYRLNVLCLALLVSAPCRVSADERPNVVVILTDDQGCGDVGVYGNRQLRTPSLDRFAADGIQLRRFYVSPVCAPTRASLMTGRYYYRTGVIHTSRGGAKMHGTETTIAEVVRAAGYRTCIFGKWHLGDNFPMRPQDQGFETSLVHRSGGIGQTPDKPNSYFDSRLWKNGRAVKGEGYCTDVFFRAAEQFIADHRDENFFVYLATNAPHTPLEVPERYVRRYQEMGLDDTTSRVYGMVENIDDNVGRLLEHLDRLSLRENTLVVFLTDNGAQQRRFNAGLRGRKSWVYEGGIRVPCFVQWPARLTGGRRLDSVSAHIDLLPTIAEACQVELDSGLKLDGRSFLPVLQAMAEQDDRFLFFQCHRGLKPRRYQNCAVVSQRYKLVAAAGTFGREDFQSPDPPDWELYDLQADPQESQNLADSHPEVVAQYAERYQRWFTDVEATRSFDPGEIHITTDASPQHLCRYQDGTYRNGEPQGWSVRILKSGIYRISIDRDLDQDGQLMLSWRGKQQGFSFRPRQTSRDVGLTAGSGTLDIWFQPVGQPRRRIRDNGTLGDVTLEWIGPS